MQDFFVCHGALKELCQRSFVNEIETALVIHYFGEILKGYLALFVVSQVIARSCFTKKNIFISV